MSGSAAPTNRNGAIGDFKSFVAPRKSVDEALEDLIRIQRDKRDVNPIERISTTLAEQDGFRLVRYQIRSRELEQDLRIAGQGLGLHTTAYASDRSEYTAIFGIIDPYNTVHAAFDVIMQKGKPSIFMAFKTPDREIPTEVVRDFLNHLDVPASWNGGADAEIEKLFDLRWQGGDKGWTSTDPVHVVVVSFERTCFAITPVMKERIDVMVPPHPDHDLESADEDAVYRAKDYYMEVGFERLCAQNSVQRPGFSSWMAGGELFLAKVVRPGLEGELASMFLQAELAGETTPPSPRR